MDLTSEDLQDVVQRFLNTNTRSELQLQLLKRLLLYTHENDVLLAQLAQSLQQAPVQQVAIHFRSLLALHYCIRHGNPKFEQYLASNNCQLNHLDKFKQFPAELSDELCAFVKRHSRYLQQTLATHRLLAQDIDQQCRLHQRKDEDGTFHQHDLAGELLLRQLNALQSHVDLLFGHFSISDLKPIMDKQLLQTHLHLTDSLLAELFQLLLFDLLHFEQEYKRTMDRLLEHFELMSKRHCAAALNLYRSMPDRATRLQSQLNEFDLLFFKPYFGGFSIVPRLLPVDLPLLNQLQAHLSNLYSKPKRKNSEKRKEKSRFAARVRRSEESELLSELADLLPLEGLKGTDKASIMRLAIAFISSRHFFKEYLTDLKLSDDSSCSSIDILQTSNMMFWLLSADGDLLYITPNVATHLGMRPVDILGNSVFEILHPCDHEQLKALLAVSTQTEKNPKSACEVLLLSNQLQQLATNDPNTMNLNQKRESFQVRVRNSLCQKSKSLGLKCPNYKMVSFAGHWCQMPPTNSSSADRLPIPSPVLMLTAHVLPSADAQLSQSHSSSLLSQHTPGLKFTQLDAQLSELLGYESSQLIGSSFFDYVHAADARTVASYFHILLSKGEVETGYYRLLCRQGGFIWICTNATLLHDPSSNKPHSVICFHQPISALESPGLVLSTQQCSFNADYKSNLSSLTDSSINQLDNLFNNNSLPESIYTDPLSSDSSPEQCQALDDFQRSLNELLEQPAKPTLSISENSQQAPVELEFLESLSKSNAIEAQTNGSNDLPCFLNSDDLDSDFVVQQLLDWDPQLLSEADCATFDRFVEPNQTPNVPSTDLQFVTNKLFEQTSCADAPLPRTSSIFAPRTADMSKGYLVFSGDAVSVLEEEKAEKEDLDLTHLAPQAGDGAVPLDFDRCPPILDAQMEDLLSELGVFVNQRSSNNLNVNANESTTICDSQIDFESIPLVCDNSATVDSTCGTLGLNLKRPLPSDLNDFDFNSQPNKHSRRDTTNDSSLSTKQMLCFCDPPEHALDACPVGPPDSLALDDPFLCLSPQNQLLDSNVDLISTDFESFNETGSDNGSHSPSVYISGKQLSDDSQDAFDQSSMALPTGQPLNFLNLSEPNGLSSLSAITRTANTLTGSTNFVCSQSIDRHNSPCADSGISSGGSLSDGLFCSSVWDSPPSSSSADSFSGAESLDNVRTDCLVTGNDQKLQVNDPSGPALLSDDSMWDTFINSNIGELLNSDEFLLNGNNSKSCNSFLNDDLFGLDLAPNSAPIVRGPSVATLPPDSNLATLLRQQLPIKTTPKVSVQNTHVNNSTVNYVSVPINNNTASVPIVSISGKCVTNANNVSTTGLVQQQQQQDQLQQIVHQTTPTTVSGKLIKLTAANSGKRTIVPVSTRNGSLQIAGKLLLSPTSNHSSLASGISNSQPSIQIVQTNGKLQPGFSLNIIHSKAPSQATIANSCISSVSSAATSVSSSANTSNSILSTSHQLLTTTTTISSSPSSSSTSSSTSSSISSTNTPLVTRTLPTGNATATSFIIKSVNGKLANGILYTPIMATTNATNATRATLTSTSGTSNSLGKATIIQATLAPSSATVSQEGASIVQKRTISAIRMSAPIKRTLASTIQSAAVPIENTCQLSPPKSFASLHSASTSAPSLNCSLNDNRQSVLLNLLVNGEDVSNGYARSSNSLSNSNSVSLNSNGLRTTRIV